MANAYTQPGYPAPGGYAPPSYPAPSYPAQAQGYSTPGAAGGWGYEDAAGSYQEFVFLIQSGTAKMDEARQNQEAKMKVFFSGIALSDNNEQKTLKMGLPKQGWICPDGVNVMAENRDPKRFPPDECVFGKFLKAVSLGGYPDAPDVDLRGAIQAFQARNLLDPKHLPTFINTRWLVRSTWLPFGQDRDTGEVKYYEVLFPVRWLGFGDEPMPHMQFIGQTSKPAPAHPVTGVPGGGVSAQGFQTPGPPGPPLGPPPGPQFSGLPSGPTYSPPNGQPAMGSAPAQQAPPGYAPPAAPPAQQQPLAQQQPPAYQPPPQSPVQLGAPANPAVNPGTIPAQADPRANIDSQVLSQLQALAKQPNQTLTTWQDCATAQIPAVSANQETLKAVLDRNGALFNALLQ